MGEGQRALGDHFGGRTVSGVAVALYAGNQILGCVARMDGAQLNFKKAIFLLLRGRSFARLGQYFL